MAELELDALTTLPAADVQGAAADIVAVAEDAYAGVEFRRGAVRDLVVLPTAALLTAVRAALAREQATLVLETALASPDAADEALLTSLMANYGMTRREATAAAGQVTLAFSSNTRRILSPAQKFVAANGQTYSVSSGYTLVPTSNEVLLTTDRLYTARPLSGGYVVTVAVTADTAGEAANLSLGATMTPSPAISGLTSAYAGSDISGGADEETNAELLARLPAARAPRTCATEAGVEAVIRDALPTVEAVRVAGFGSSLQRRGTSTLPLSLPGRVDAWVRPAKLFGTVEVTKSALLVDTSGGNGVWQVTVGRDDAPGLYSVDRVAPTAEAGSAAAGYSISSVTRTYNATAGTGDVSLVDIPDVASATQAAFSRYAGAVVRFVDPDTSLAGLIVGSSSKSYAVRLRYADGVLALQQAVSAEDVESTGGDCLVRGGSPAYVTVGVTIGLRAGAEAPDEDAVAEAVADAINSTGLTNVLGVTTIAAAVQPLLSTGAVFTAATMTATLYKADGTTAALSGAVALDAGVDYAAAVSPDSVAFYCRPADVTVTTTDI